MIVLPILIALGVGAVVVGCGSDDGNGGGNGVGDADTDSDIDTDTDTDVDTDTVTDTDTDTDTDPCDDRIGVNGNYFKTSIGDEAVSMKSVKMHNGFMELMLGRPGNCLARSFIDEGDPMGYDSDPVANCDSDYAIGLNMGDSTPISPVYSHLISAGDNLRAVPFEYQGTIYEGTGDETPDVTKSGMAFIDGVTDPGSESEMIQSLAQVVVAASLPEEGLVMEPTGVKSSVLYEAEGDSMIGLAATEPLSGNGMFLSYGFNFIQWLRQNSVEFPVFTSGQNPSAVAMLPDEVTLEETIAAVVNIEGGTESWQVAGASIDVIDTLIPAESADPKVANIPLGANVTLVPFPEIPLTDDKAYGMVVGGESGQLTTLYVIDLVNHIVAGSIDLSGYADQVNGIALHDDMVALSIDGAENGEGASSGHVITIDISDPTAPSVIKVIEDLGYGMGPLAMHEVSGEVYIKVACMASFCEDEPTESDPPYETMISIDHELVE